MTNESDANGFAAVYPNGAKNLSNVSTWNVYYDDSVFGGTSSAPDDVGFFRTIASTLQTTIGIDPNKVFISGFSAGAYMAHRACIDAADLFAGCGSVEGHINQNSPGDTRTVPNPSGPVAIIIFHGDKDTTAPYCGNTTNTKPIQPSVDGDFSYWVSADNCSTISSTSSPPSPPSTTVCTGINGTPTTLSTETATTCSNGTEIQFYRLYGGTHNWVTSDLRPPHVPDNPIFGSSSNPVFLDDLLWNFFLTHPKTSGNLATHFLVTAPTSVVARASFSITVKALDQGGGLANGYSGTVHFTSNDGGATLPANYTFISSDNGVHTFTNAVTLVALGSDTVTATDTVTSSINGNATVNVGVGPTSQFVVVAPGTATAGIGLSFTVTAKDQFGNTTPGYAGTVHFTSSDGAATLPANSTLSSGTRTLPATLKTSGNRTITAADSVTNSIMGMSGTIAVSAAPANHYLLTVPPTATPSWPFTIRLVAQDQFNNTDTNYTGTAHFTTTDAAGGVVVPADYTFQVPDNGQKTFSNGVTLQTMGTQSISANDTVTSSISATSSIMVVNDLPITSQARNINIFRANVPVVVASFTDADIKENGNNLSAQINWGDGTAPAPGVVKRVATTNVFNVVSSHAYATKGDFDVTVTMIDSNGSMAVANSTARFLPRNFSF